MEQKNFKETLKFEKYQKGQNITATDCALVNELFERNDFKYDSNIPEDLNTFRIIAKIGDVIAGYSIVKESEPFGILCNLLVDSEYRGLKIGRQMDVLRIDYC